MIKRDQYRWLSNKRVERLAPKRRLDLLEKGKKDIEKTLRQYEKSQKQLGGKTGKEVFSTNYQDMKHVLSMPDYTDEQQKAKLKSMRTLIRRESFTVSGATRQLKKLERGSYGEFLTETMSQEDRAELVEHVRGIFGSFSAEDIEKIGSDEVVKIAMRFYSRDIDHKEAERRAKISIRKRLNKIKEGTPVDPGSPLGLINRGV